MCCYNTTLLCRVLCCIIIISGKAIYTYVNYYLAVKRGTTDTFKVEIKVDFVFIFCNKNVCQSKQS